MFLFSYYNYNFLFFFQVYAKESAFLPLFLVKKKTKQHYKKRKKTHKNLHFNLTILNYSLFTEREKLRDNYLKKLFSVLFEVLIRQQK